MIQKAKQPYLRSCKISFVLSMVIRDVEAAGMMMIGVREPVDESSL